MFNCWSVDFKTISVPFTWARSKVICVAIVTSWSWIGLWRHCWRRQRMGASALYRFGVTFRHSMSASIRVLFYPIFLIIVHSLLQNGLRMVARALWRPAALSAVPWLCRCTRLRLVQGLRPGTTLRAKTDLHNWQPFLNRLADIKVVFHIRVGHDKGTHCYFGFLHCSPGGILVAWNKYVLVNFLALTIPCVHLVASTV